MEFDLSKIEFSWQDLRNKVKIPKKISNNLIYLVGIHMGDGNLHHCKSTRTYTASYYGHLIDEDEFYQSYISSIIENLFNKKTKTYKDFRKGHSYLKIYVRSKAIFTFLSKIAKLPIGSKSNLGMPNYIINLDLNLKKYFIKGLSDTEFCLTFKKRHKTKHYYPVIEYGTSSNKLAKETSELLEDFGFKLTRLFNYPTKRNGKDLTTNQININGVENLEKWMREIGFNSQKHMTKYLIWKKYGFCPPYTNILQRKAILDRDLDINSFYTKTL